MTMAGRFKSLIPKKIRSAFGHAVIRAAQIETLVRRIDALERAVAELSPEIVTVSPEVDAVIQSFVRAHGLHGLDVAVSKNDLMFQYISREQPDKAAAYRWYLESGFQMYQIVEQIVASKWGALGRVQSVLDFASGYGRLTRFLVRGLPPDRVWVAEIKKRAVDFQRAQFGVGGFVSTVAPGELHVDRRFDFIFVASLFSHLPDSTFAPWLQRLCDLLAPRGLIAFSVHDMAREGESSARNGDEDPRISFEAASEEMILFSEDAALNPDAYGVSSVNEAYVAKVVAALRSGRWRHWRYPKALHQRQALYVLSRDPLDDCSHIRLPRFAGP